MKLERIPKYKTWLDEGYIRNIALNNGVITIEYGGGQQVTIEAADLLDID